VRPAQSSQILPDTPARRGTTTGTPDTSAGIRAQHSSRYAGHKFVHVMHSHQKRRIFRGVDPLLPVRQAFHRAGEHSSGFVEQ
jgi:hypothetical protein